MRRSSGRDEQSNDTRRAPANRPSAEHSLTQRPMTPPNLMDIPTLQRLFGNDVTTRILTLQRTSEAPGAPPRTSQQSEEDSHAPGSFHEPSPEPSPTLQGSAADFFNKDLDFGPDYGPGTGVELNLNRGQDKKTPAFNDSVHGVRFSARSEKSGEKMKEIFDFVKSVSPHFTQELSKAGNVEVRLDKTKGGGPGEYLADENTIILNSRAATVKKLCGTAVFEILNAASKQALAKLKEEALSDRIKDRAAVEKLKPDVFYAREIERIEWKNTIRHRAIMAEAEKSESDADRFSGEVDEDFESFYKRQVATNHAESYRHEYNNLRVRAVSTPLRAARADASDSKE
ncbi:hypothetical protein AB0467_12400 [Streptomyces sp. NPDC052095]|uniref:hypothetical protein n=1 Tax=unclassified Streptomyces TaxID=2593676 RepID=UPI00344E4DB2